MPRNPRQFRLQAKNIFLTYPKCNLSAQLALDKLLSISTHPDRNLNPKYITVGQEHHQPTEEHPDGELHLHAFIQFSDKVQTPFRQHQRRRIQAQGCKCQYLQHIDCVGHHYHHRGQETSGNLETQNLHQLPATLDYYYDCISFVSELLGLD